MRALVLAIAAASGLLGVSVIIGWVLRLPALVQVFPGSSSMTLSTALLFLLGAAALSGIQAGRTALARSAAGATLLLAAAVLLEHATGAYLGIDMRWAQDWIADGNPTPGRTAASTGGAFLALGAGALAVAGRRGGAWFPFVAAGIMVVLASINLLGYLLRLEDLFPVLQGNRMAMHTSIGALLLGGGLLAAASATVAKARDEPLAIARRIGTTAIAWLVLTAVVSGGAVFALMQQNLQQSAGAMLLNMLEVRQTVLLSQLAQGRSEVGLIVTQSVLHRAMRAGDGAGVLAAIHGFVGAEFSGLAVQDASGRELASAGRFAGPVERRHRIAGEGDAEIVSSGLDIHLRLRTEIRAGGGALGILVSEQPMGLLTNFMKGEGAHGASGEMALCHGSGGRMWCFPQRLNPRAFDVARQDASGTRLPMSYALDGATGVVRTRDYRAQNVLAAHGPVGGTGLGMVVKVDTAELFAPVRAQILNVLLAALLTVLLGAWLLRRRVLPLATELHQAEAEARAAREKLQKIADNVPALVGYVDAQRRYQFANRAYFDWFGFDHRAMLNRPMLDVIGAENFARVKDHSARALAGARTEFIDHIPAPGGFRAVHTSYIPDPDPDGRILGYFVLSSDVTAAESARKELDRVLRQLDLALDASRVTVWESDLRSDEVVLSDAWAELLERPRGETRTTVAELASLVHPEDLQEVTRLSMETIRGKRDHYSVEHRVRASSGHWKWIISRGQVTEREPSTGKAVRMAGTNLDITERKNAELQMEFLANYDGLTGVANRALFRDRVARAIGRCKRSGARAALMYLDIDKFKGINDSLGHAAGDELLKEFARRLGSVVRATDTVGRLGGDEFAVLLEDVKDEAAPGRIAQKILDAMKVPVDADGKDLVVTTSIGLAMFCGEAEPEELVKRADEALYEAKAAGRNTYRVAA